MIPSTSPQHSVASSPGFPLPHPQAFHDLIPRLSTTLSPGLPRPYPQAFHYLIPRPSTTLSPGFPLPHPQAFHDLIPQPHPQASQLCSWPQKSSEAWLVEEPILWLPGDLAMHLCSPNAFMFSRDTAKSSHSRSCPMPTGP